MPSETIKVTVWNEFIHEKTDEPARKLYPGGIHKAIASSLTKHKNKEVKTATLQDPENGLSEDVLAWTDVLIWWGHVAHDMVEDKVAERVKKHVLDGMGLIALHSGAMSKVFKSLMGTTCRVKWREDERKELIWCVSPGHPITQGIGECITLEKTEMYGEFFDIPEPDELIFISWFEGGEVFRSGCCFNRGKGKIFYFRPGHETYPLFHNRTILRIIKNAVKWARRSDGPECFFGERPLPEELK